MFAKVSIPTITKVCFCSSWSHKLPQNRSNDGVWRGIAGESMRAAQTSDTQLSAAILNERHLNTFRYTLHPPLHPILKSCLRYSDDNYASWDFFVWYRHLVLTFDVVVSSIFYQATRRCVWRYKISRLVRKKNTARGYVVFAYFGQQPYCISNSGRYRL